MFLVREEETSNEGVMQENGNNKWNRGPVMVIRDGIQSARRELTLVLTGIVTSSSELGMKGEKLDEEGEILRW